MKKIKLKARAKINLTLEILNKREDNYHNLRSVFQKIDLYDDLIIEKNNTNKFILKTNIENLNNKDNIIYKAYKILKDKYIQISGINVFLNKKIPQGAGLGGGSADCASFILGINKLFNLNMSTYEIETIGKSLGADVVPCLYDQAVIAEGIGDIITPINTNFKFYIIIIKPQISYNTKEMYNLIDKTKIKSKKNVTNNVIQGLKENNIDLISKNLYNTFEEIELESSMTNQLKNELIKNGAINSLMSGSGSCVYGIYRNKKLARKAYNNLKKQYETYLCNSYNKVYIK